VYVTPSGSKYHAAGCRYLKGRHSPVALTDVDAAKGPCPAPPQRCAIRPSGESAITPLDERVRLARRRHGVGRVRDLPTRTTIALYTDPLSTQESGDRLRDLPARLKVRASVVAARTFKPSDYVGLSEHARSSGEQGWLAWEIVPYLTWLEVYVQDSMPHLSDAVRRALRSTRTAAEKFLPDSKRGLARGEKYEYPNSAAFIESRERDREIVNAGLEVPVAWDPLPPIETLAKQIVEQMKSRGYQPSQIMSALSRAGQSMTPEAEVIRAENLRWLQDEIDRRFNSDDGDVKSTAPGEERRGKPGPDFVVVSSGVAVTERQIAIGRAKAAYLEAHGNVQEARQALKIEGHPIPRSTFYDYLNVLDAQERGWRDSVMKSEGPGIPEGTHISRSRRKTRANGS
jgi:hypothetical protein